MIPHPGENFLGITETTLFYVRWNVLGFTAAGGERGCQTLRQGGGEWRDLSPAVPHAAETLR